MSSQQDFGDFFGSTPRGDVTAHNDYNTQIDDDSSLEIRVSADAQRPVVRDETVTLPRFIPNIPLTEPSNAPLVSTSDLFDMNLFDDDETSDEEAGEPARVSYPFDRTAEELPDATSDGSEPIEIPNSQNHFSRRPLFLPGQVHPLNDDNAPPLEYGTAPPDFRPGSNLSAQGQSTYSSGPAMNAYMLGNPWSWAAANNIGPSQGTQPDQPRFVGGQVLIPTLDQTPSPASTQTVQPTPQVTVPAPASGLNYTQSSEGPDDHPNQSGRMQTRDDGRRYRMDYDKAREQFPNMNQAFLRQWASGDLRVVQKQAASTTSASNATPALPSQATHGTTQGNAGMAFPMPPMANDPAIIVTRGAPARRGLTCTVGPMALVTPTTPVQAESPSPSMNVHRPSTIPFLGRVQPPMGTPVDPVTLAMYQARYRHLGSRWAQPSSRANP